MRISDQDVVALAPGEGKQLTVGVTIQKEGDREFDVAAVMS